MAEVNTSPMGKSDFLYHFTNTYLSEAVKETILIENWEEKDFDHRYVEYIDIFNTIKDEFLEKGAKGSEIINILKKNKNKIVNIFNDTISRHFIKELKKQGCNNVQLAKDFIQKNIPLGDMINPETLHIFRKFEEKILIENKEKPKWGKKKIWNNF
jgi:hypothetical protein